MSFKNRSDPSVRRDRNISIILFWFRFELDFEVLRRKGSLVSLGNASGAVPPFTPFKLTPKNIKLTRPT